MEPQRTSWKPSCREVHRLVSEAMDRELSLLERSRMRLHLLVCGACTRFHGQMDLLRRAMRQGPPAKQPGHSGEGQP
ncbi:MAG: zf-HC2 domain-containing protein [Massilia sp.]|nr:zf-HC2 domain-containing protein [Massilia sp.]